MTSPELLLVVEAEDGIRIRRMSAEPARVLAEHRLLPITRPYPLRLRVLADGRGWVCGQFSERQVFAAIQPDGRAGQLLPAVPGHGVLDPANGHIHGNGSMTVLEPVREAPEGQTWLHTWHSGESWVTELLPMSVSDVSFAARGQTWFVGCQRPSMRTAPSSVSEPAVWVRDAPGQPAHLLPFNLDVASRARGALSKWLLDWPEVESLHGVCAECDPPLLIADSPDLFDLPFSCLYWPTGQQLWHAHAIPWIGVGLVPIPDGLVVFASERLFVRHGNTDLRPLDPMPGLRRALARERADLIPLDLRIVAGDTLDGQSLAVSMEWGHEDQTGSALALSHDGGDTWNVLTLAIGQPRIRHVAWIR